MTDNSNTGPALGFLTTPSTDLDTRSFGQKLVGINFNPSGDPNVNRAKELCAELADILHNHYLNYAMHYPIPAELYHHAVGEILNAQMNVVKVLTFK